MRRSAPGVRRAALEAKRWKLFRIATREDPGVLLGTYQGRRDAKKALEQIAFQPEPLR
jgi:hypothetical protein